MTTDELDNKILKRGLKGQEEKLKRNIKDEIWNWIFSRFLKYRDS